MRPDERLGARGLDRSDLQAGVRRRQQHDGEPCGRVTRHLDDRDRGPGCHQSRGDQADGEYPGERVAHRLHPSGAAVVGDETPRQEDAGAADDRDHDANGPDESAPAGAGADRAHPTGATGHGRGAGVVSSRPRTAATPCSTPSSVRSRWARHATATAFTSSGVTKVLADNTACACAARMSQIAARGLAPRRTPGALRLARHNATAYCATLGATSTDSVARWAESHSWVLHTGRSSPERELPAAVLDEARFGVGVRVADRRRQREPVELALDEGVGPELGERVLRGDHEVRSWKRPRLAVHAHLVLLHGLEQRGLGPGRRAVELVHEHHVREHRSGPELPGSGVGREHRHTRYVGGQEVGVTLHARELGTERDRQRSGEDGLSHAGHVFDEQVTARERRHGRRGQGAGGSEEDPAQVLDERPTESDRGLDGDVDFAVAVEHLDVGKQSRAWASGHGDDAVGGRLALPKVGGLHQVHVIGRFRRELKALPGTTWSLPPLAPEVVAGRIRSSGGCQNSSSLSSGTVAMARLVHRASGHGCWPA